jgi:hypothetical protein
MKRNHNIDEDEDPLEELHRIREKLAEEYKKDPISFREKLRNNPLNARLKVSPLKPVANTWEELLQLKKKKKASAKK